jgi:hypothetical protein
MGAMLDPVLDLPHTMNEMPDTTDGIVGRTSKVHAVRMVKSWSGTKVRRRRRTMSKVWTDRTAFGKGRVVDGHCTNQRGSLRKIELPVL